MAKVVARACRTLWLAALPGLAANALADPAAARQLAQVTVIGVTPLPGSGVELDKVPGNVQTMSAQDLDRGGAAGLPDAAAARMSSVNLNDEGGSPYQPDLVYRGFEASPVSGIAQGLAVYQDGVRINEAFGDTVNWDLVPQFAVDRLTVQSNNPVFGLNALGGAVTLGMKTGFNTRGGDAQVSGGSFGSINGYAGYGARLGSFGVYTAAGALHDDGFRDHSPSALRQAYTDLGYEDERLTLHLAVTAAGNDIGATGPTPVQMLRQDPRSVFTHPQTTHNAVQLVDLSGNYQPADRQSLSADVYLRRFRQRLLDGNTTDVLPCANNTAYFCLEGAGDYPGDALYDSSGNQVPTAVLPAGATPGEIDRTDTATVGSGGSLQWSLLKPLLGRGNSLVLGASFDHGGTAYQARGELGSLQPDLGVAGAGIVIDQSYSATAQPPLEQPVSVRADNDAYGAYFTDTLDLTPAFAWTLGGRYNRASIDLQDHIGSRLDATHAYHRFNPGTGLSYRFAETVTAYAGYSEASRTPTAAELSCANPASPCLLDAFLVSDPDLKQVASRTWEAGLRGHFGAGLPGRFGWNLGLYRTDNRDDIILLATAVNGFGYFSNAGTTRRQGLESGLSYRSAHWQLNAGYSRLDATFRERLTLASNSPAADAQGNIVVQSGDRIPLTPRNRATFQAEYSASAAWKLDTDLRYVGGQYLAGDASNQEPKLPACTVVDLRGSYEPRPWLRLFAGIDNVFDRTYYTYGSFTRLDNLPPNFKLTDPRSYSPSPGRSFFGGVRLRF
ncbi:MAG: TonB-dependent receptor [Nevskia sp.]|nr:TonB-dependent receptor [Nevskia sp.]